MNKLEVLLSAVGALNRASGWEFVPTSYHRADGTAHRTGDALDVAARAGPLGANRLTRAGIPYYDGSMIVPLMIVLLRARPELMQLGIGEVLIEADHLHLELPTPSRPQHGTTSLGIYAPGVCNDLVCVPQLARDPIPLRSFLDMAIPQEVKNALRSGKIHITGSPAEAQAVARYLASEGGGPTRAELGGATRAELGGPDDGGIALPTPADLTPPPMSASIAQAGSPFFRPVNCIISQPPIPPAARSPKWASVIGLLAAVLKPAAPRQATQTFAGAPLSTAIVIPQPALGERSEEHILGARVEIGFPGITAAAGTPVTFDLFSSVEGAADPAPGVPFDNSGNHFATGNFQVVPAKASESFVVQVLFWQVINSLPFPFVFTNWSDNAAFYAAPQRTTLNLRMSQGPNGTSFTITQLTMLHAGFSKLLDELGASLK